MMIRAVDQEAVNGRSAGPGGKGQAVQEGAELP
jgi:hypothetical protein